MKNLKKLERSELKTISGNGLFQGASLLLVEKLAALPDLVENALCDIQCKINGVVEIKLLKCGSTC